jgi:hypothetical protein
MRRLAVMLAIGLLSTVGAKVASASVIWRSSYDNGDLSAWSKIEAVKPDRLTVVNDPQGGKARVLQVKVIQGDDPINASGNRNEVVYTGDNIQEGDERFYEWSTLWPKSYQSADAWQLFTQWHHTGTSGSPPVELYAIGDQIYLRCSGEVVWSAPLDKGRWHRFMIHIKWSKDKSKGFVELFQDGKMTLPKTYAKTLFPGQGAYLKQGLYRKETVKQEQTIYHSGLTVATSMSDLGSYDSSGSESWGDISHSQASGGCATSSFGLAWPALGAGLLMLFRRLQQRRRAEVPVRRS